MDEDPQAYTSGRKMKGFNKKTQNTGKKLQVPNRQIKYVEGQTDNNRRKEPRQHVCRRSDCGVATVERTGELNEIIKGAEERLAGNMNKQN